MSRKTLPSCLSYGSANPDKSSISLIRWILIVRAACVACIQYTARAAICIVLADRLWTDHRAISLELLVAGPWDLPISFIRPLVSSVLNFSQIRGPKFQKGRQCRHLTGYFDPKKILGPYSQGTRARQVIRHTPLESGKQELSTGICFEAEFYC